MFVESGRLVFFYSCLPLLLRDFVFSAKVMLRVPGLPCLISKGARLSVAVFTGRSSDMKFSLSFEVVVMFSIGVWCSVVDAISCMRITWVLTIDVRVAI